MGFTVPLIVAELVVMLVAAVVVTVGTAAVVKEITFP